MDTPSKNVFDLANKTALVTGSSSGIGKAIAKALLENGARVILHGKEPSDEATETLNEFKQLDPETQIFFQDMSEVTAATSFSSFLESNHLQVDILVLNCAVQVRKAFSEMTTEDINWQVQTNFIANYQLIQELSPSMLANGWGRVLCIGSVQEELPHPDFTVYAAMKSGQKNLVENLARQFGPNGVTVNNLAPGVFVTDRNRKALENEEYAKLVLAKIPVKFFAESRDCAGAALLLCSDAGRYINGATLAVDGGMSLPQ
jgi:NAD(P)-dependent dehydrogenase (short-subunit alcohol dehydrogenase family)